MPSPDKPPLTRAVVLRGIGFAVAIASGAVAAWLVVTGDNQQTLRIGMLVGLWGLVLGAYSMFGARRGLGVEHGADPGREIALRETAELERRVDADERRDWESRLERLINREISSAVGRETAALRNEIAHLRQELLDKVGGQLRLERIETTRLIGSDLEALQHEVRQLKDANGNPAAPAVRELLAASNDPRLAVRPVVEPARVRPISRSTAAVEADVRPAVGERPEPPRVTDPAARVHRAPEPLSAQPRATRPPVTRPPVTEPPAVAQPAATLPTAPGPAAEQPAATQPSTTKQAEQPESQKPESKKPEATKSETTQSETKRPESKKSEAKKPEATRPESTTSETKKSETKKSETTKSETKKSETTKPEATKPEAKDPETKQPNGGDPFAGLPRLSRFTDFEPPVTNGQNGNGSGYNGNGHDGNGHAANGNGHAPTDPQYTGRRRRPDETAAAAAGRHANRGNGADANGGGRRRRNDDEAEGGDLLARLLARESSDEG